MVFDMVKDLFCTVFVTLEAKSNQIFIPKSALRIPWEIDALAISLQNGVKSYFSKKLKHLLMTNFWAEGVLNGFLGPFHTNLNGKKHARQKISKLRLQKSRIYWNQGIWHEMKAEVFTFQTMYISSHKNIDELWNINFNRRGDGNLCLFCDSNYRVRHLF